jgi:hypothetical protein
VRDIDLSITSIPSNYRRHKDVKIVLKTAQAIHTTTDSLRVAKWADLYVATPPIPKSF